MSIHPKVKAAGQTSAVVGSVAVIAAALGLKLDSSLVEAVVVIIAAALPTIAGYQKRATPKPAAKLRQAQGEKLR